MGHAALLSKVPAAHSRRPAGASPHTDQGLKLPAHGWNAALLQVPVAVKKLKPEVLTNARDLREFLAEANTLRQLKHR